MNKEEEHPSYGVVTVTRVSGGNETCFMSAVPNQNRLSLRVRTARKIRSLSEDRARPTQETIVDVEMTYQQFARMLSSIGLGEGVPCTITRREGELVEPCPAEDKAERYKEDVRVKASKLEKELAALLSDARDTLEGGGSYLSKSKRQELLDKIRRVNKIANDEIPFILKQLDRAIENTVHEAKSSVSSFANRMMDRLKGAADAAGVQLPEATNPQLDVERPDVEERTDGEAGNHG